MTSRAICGLILAAALAIPSSAAAEKLKPFKLKTVDGVEKTLADVLGKATLVVFFFPTCPYCNAAFPKVQKLYDTYLEQGLSMVWINVVPDERKLIPEWRAKHGYTVPVLLGGRSTPNDYKVRMTPTHYLLDARGEILSKQDGFNPGDEVRLEQQIQKALAP
ncbi:MAG TPA: TlpA disulfide reductase family protein [Vicinamibacterales bacterium]|nr:TlpA disulfide reductase family protein [Vicinamibacterales bacterium]